jgi:hypothetical protein
MKMELIEGPVTITKLLLALIAIALIYGPALIACASLIGLVWLARDEQREPRGRIQAFFGGLMYLAAAALSIYILLMSYEWFPLEVGTSGLILFVSWGVTIILMALWSGLIALYPKSPNKKRQRHHDQSGW